MNPQRQVGNSGPFRAIALATTILVIVTIGCGSDDSKPTGPSSPFAGSWSVVFAGTYTGGGTIVIGSNGKFSANVLLNDGTQDFTNTVAATVSSAGTVTDGTIYYSGQEIGTITGTFVANSGSGAWSTVYSTSGTWSASRQ